MKATLVDKAKSILEGIEIGFFDTAKNWDEDNYDEYYQYFSHPDFEVRKYSLLIFTAGLGNWLMGSSIIFHPNKNQIYNSSKDSIYNVEDYIRTFIDYREAIKHEFPILYNVIVNYLIQLNNTEQFSLIEKQLYLVLREVLTDSGLEVHQYNFNDLLREVGLPTFFKD
ncbi:hypothetical protein ACQKNX_06300 [Lysinibacillus sp. NPDC093712]|uniref:hypothetical protein n=1 Tax=Lysinibacillus sp. NPDC093712 TaxID=3390579 RepID=UPI003D04FDC9